MYTVNLNFKKMDPCDWFCGPGSHIILFPDNTHPFKQRLKNYYKAIQLYINWLCWSSRWRWR